MNFRSSSKVISLLLPFIRHLIALCALAALEIYLFYQCRRERSPESAEGGQKPSEGSRLSPEPWKGSVKGVSLTNKLLMSLTSKAHGPISDQQLIAAMQKPALKEKAATRGESPNPDPSFYPAALGTSATSLL